LTIKALEAMNAGGVNGIIGDGYRKVNATISRFLSMATFI